MLPEIGPAFRRRLNAFARDRLRVSVHLCKGPNCRRFTAEHRWLRKDGIFLDCDQGPAPHGAWLCSPGCLQAAVHAWLASPGRARQYTMPRLPRMPYRLRLLRMGILSEADLHRALTHAERTGVPLSHALLELSLVTEEELAGALAIENGCAYYALAPSPLPSGFKLPEMLAQRYGAATVHADSERIVVGFVHRIDRGLLAMLERITGQRAEGCFITATHRSFQLGRHEKDAGYGMGSRRCTSEPALNRLEAAQSIVEQAVRLGAETVSLARSGETVWVRSGSGDGAPQDSVFDLAEETGSLPAFPAQASSLKRNEKNRKLL